MLEPLPLLDRLREAFLRWKEAAAQRSARGELRASASERVALEQFVALLDAAPTDLHDAWSAMREELDHERDDARCRCGHPLAHHDASGSCFHIVGCATVCDCT